ncbi:MAG: IS110 family transposase, partial [Acidimicrobiaceae bacterium]|nr:IS110 family transposase [Acidimicrobiaceae bacterium]
GAFRAVIEATASSEWLVELIEPLAEKVVLAHPGKLRVIAESTKKTDRLDATVLAEFLARGQIPEAFRPTPRQREHRALVRHRQHLKQSITALKNKMRRIAADYNADRKDLFTADGWAALRAVKLREADRFVLDQLHAGWQHLEGQLTALGERLKAFAAKAPAKEAEARAKLATIPGVGPVTIDVVVSELGDITRFHSVKAACAYAGLVPAVRQSGAKRAKDLGITKTGSPLLRWALVEAAWRVIRQGAAWRRVYEQVKTKAGGKKAIVAVARRLLVVMAAMLRDGTNYNFLKVGEPSAT